jgi:cobalt-zinc-cadmium efflux system membrane fusion protein
MNKRTLVILALCCLAILAFYLLIFPIPKEAHHHHEEEPHEAKVKLSQQAINDNKIKVEMAGPVDFQIKLNVMGKIIPNEDRTVAISPRFPGIVKTVHKKLGDFVYKDEVLAEIESNESLQDYEMKSPIDGIIIKKTINLGMSLSGQESAYIVSDLSSVWADFTIYRQDISEVQIGNSIQVASLNGKLYQTSNISYISPLGNENTQSIIARTVLKNPKGIWKPGLFVTGEITLETIAVPIAVRDSALQSIKNVDVIFIANDDYFEAVPVKVGRKNREWVEVLSGVPPGSPYVSQNSYLLKADLEKSGAEHEH